jgi:drug/metabolite transporter (DMT)-like permease
MAFTTLPTPSKYYMYGGKGTVATCTLQGFMIQMGTVACLLGASLAAYYSVTIKEGWSEAKMKRNHLIYYLLIPPIIIGLSFAFAGIPHYDNVGIWCSNSAK